MQLVKHLCPLKSLVLLLASFTSQISLAAETAPLPEQAQSAPESPIVDPSQVSDAVELNLTAYQPEYALYPVRIIRINELLIPTSNASELYLKPGQYKLSLVPDFSNIKNRKIFMQQLFEVQTVEIALSSNSVLLGARIMDGQSKKWRVEQLQLNESQLSGDTRIKYD